MLGFSRKSIAGIGAASVVLAASTGVAAASDAMPDASLDAAAQTYQRVFPQMSDAAARSAAAGEDARKQLQEQLTEGTAATYGGAWFDPPSGVLHVSATTGATAARADLLGSQLEVRVQTQLVRHSLAQLDRTADALRRGSSALSRGARGQVGIDVRANRVVAAVPQQQLGAFRGGNVPAGVTVVKDPDVQTEEDAGCTSRAACDWTVRAGSMLWRSSAGNNVCSVGFTARNSSNQRYVYSAGHCSNGNNVTWGTGGLSIGPMQASINSGVLDASIIRVTNPWFTTDTGGEIYLETAAGRTIPLNGVAPSVSYMLQGERVCLSAHYTQPNGPNSCGVIGAVSDSAVRGMTRVDGLDGCPGDSGGGWYWVTSTGRRVAYGLHSRSDTGCRGSAGGRRSWYSPIGAVKQQWTPSLNVEIRP